MSQTFWTWVPRACICAPHAGGWLNLGQDLKPWDPNSTLSKLQVTSLPSSFSWSLLSLSLYEQCPSRDFFFFFLLSFSWIYVSRVGLWAPGRQRFRALSIVTWWCPPVCLMGKHSSASAEGRTNEERARDTEIYPSVAPGDVLRVSWCTGTDGSSKSLTNGFV